MLSRFKDIVAVDGTILRLCDKLANKWSASRTNHTKEAIKLHVITSALVVGQRHVAIFPGKTAEGKTLQIDDWVKDMVLLVDFGFFKYNIFSRIKSTAITSLVILKRILQRSLPRACKSHDFITMVKCICCWST
jgi:hypothetical protein